MSTKKYTIDSFAPRLDSFLKPLLKKAGFDLSYEMVSEEPVHPDFESPDITIKFGGRDVDVLLANKAELLLALEHISMEALGIASEDHARVSFDANDYRALRIEELRLSAGAAAEKVKRTGAPFFFNPMNSRERRIIHLSLRNETDIRSESTGTGPFRQVVVLPVGMPLPEPIRPPRPMPPRDGPRDRDRRQGGGGRPGGRHGGPPRRGGGGGRRP